LVKGIKNGVRKAAQKLSNIDWYRTFTKLLHPWGHLDIRIGNLRIVSRQHRGVTRFWNPFHFEKIPRAHQNRFFRDFPKPSIGISIGFRMWNFVFFDIQINGATARWEDYFPGASSGGGNKFRFFYKIPAGDPAEANYPDGTPHPFFFSGKNWQLPCLGHGRFGRGMGGPLFQNTLPPNHSWLPINLVERFVNYVQTCMKYINFRSHKRYKWF
jgi:hypothetical protein